MATGVLAAVGMAGMVAAVSAQPVLGGRAEGDGTTAVAREIDGLLRDLDAAEFGRRESATRRLSELAALDDRALLEMAQREDLTLEQRFRMVTVLRKRFMSSPRGAIGVQFSRSGPPPVVGTMQEGFPAQRLDVLKPGDVIVEVDGVDLGKDQAWNSNPQSMYRIQSLIHSRDPGEQLPARIFRPRKAVVNNPAGVAAPPEQFVDGEFMDIVIPLGRMSDLRPPPGLPNSVRKDLLNAAWRVRAERLGLSNVKHVPSIGTGLDAEEWDPYRPQLYLGQSDAVMVPGPFRAGAERSDGHRLSMLMAQQLNLNEARLQLQQQQRIRIIANANAIHGGDPGAYGRIMPTDITITHEGEEGAIAGAEPMRPRQDSASVQLMRLERLRLELQSLEARAQTADGVNERRAFEDAIGQLREQIKIAETEVRSVLRSSTAAAQP